MLWAVGCRQILSQIGHDEGAERADDKVLRLETSREHDPKAVQSGKPQYQHVDAFRQGSGDVATSTDRLTKARDARRRNKPANNTFERDAGPGPSLEGVAKAQSLYDFPLSPRSLPPAPLVPLRIFVDPTQPDRRDKPCRL